MIPVWYALYQAAFFVDHLTMYGSTCRTELHASKTSILVYLSLEFVQTVDKLEATLLNNYMKHKIMDKPLKPFCPFISIYIYISQTIHPNQTSLIPLLNQKSTFLVLAYLFLIFLSKLGRTKSLICITCQAVTYQSSTLYLPNILNQSSVSSFDQWFHSLTLIFTSVYVPLKLHTILSLLLPPCSLYPHV